MEEVERKVYEIEGGPAYPHMPAMASQSPESSSPRGKSLLAQPQLCHLEGL